MYVVTMHRWGDDESHNYVLGVYSTKELALRAGRAEMEHRGMKYEPKITETLLDECVK